MDQGDDGTADSGGAPKPGDVKRIRRMPPATIDLTATPVPEPASGSGESTRPTPDAAESAATPGASAASSEPPKPGGPGRRFGLGQPWRIAAAGLAVTLVVALAVAWLVAGASQRRQTRALEGRLVIVEAQLGELAGRPLPAAADPREIAALGARLATLQAQIEAQLRDLAGRPVPVGADPNQVAALAGRLDDMAKRLQTTEQVLNRMDAVTKRVDALELTGRRLDEIAAQVVRIEAALAAPRPTESDPALPARLAALDSATKALLGRIGELEKRLDQVAATARDADRQAETASEAAAKRPVAATDPAVRFAVLAAALRSAVERGDPFAAELAALRPLAPDPAALAPLAPFAASGIATPAALARDLSALLPALIAAAAPAPTDGGLLDRLKATTGHLVRVRRVGETPGDDPAAVLARIEAAAARRDIAGALADLAKLPPAARAPAEAWIKSAAGRTAALEAARRLAAGALAGLAAPAP